VGYLYRRPDVLLWLIVILIFTWLSYFQGLKELGREELNEENLLKSQSQETQSSENLPTFMDEGSWFKKNQIYCLEENYRNIDDLTLEKLKRIDARSLKLLLIPGLRGMKFYSENRVVSEQLKAYFASEVENENDAEIMIKQIIEDDCIVYYAIDSYGNYLMKIDDQYNDQDLFEPQAMIYCLLLEKKLQILSEADEVEDNGVDLKGVFIPSTTIFAVDRWHDIKSESNDLLVANPSAKSEAIGFYLELLVEGMRRSAIDKADYVVRCEDVIVQKKYPQVELIDAQQETIFQDDIELRYLQEKKIDTNIKIINGKLFIEQKEDTDRGVG